MRVHHGSNHYKNDSVCLGIDKMVTNRRRKKFEPLIRQELESAGGVLTLPELVKRIGLKDSFYNRLNR